MQLDPDCAVLDLQNTHIYLKEIKKQKAKEKAELEEMKEKHAKKKAEGEEKAERSGMKRTKNDAKEKGTKMGNKSRQATPTTSGTTDPRPWGGGRGRGRIATAIRIIPPS